MKRKTIISKNPKKMKRKFPYTKTNTVTSRWTPKNINLGNIPKKKKGVQVMTRKDGKPNCFVCYKKLDLLRKLMDMKANDKDYTDEYNTLRLRVNNTIVRLPSNKKHGLFRHVKCEPGTANHDKNKQLKKHYQKTLAN